MTERAYMTGIIDQNDDSLDTDKGKVVSFAFYDNLGYSYTAQFSIKPVQTPDTSTTPPTMIKTPHEYRMYMTDIFDSDGKSILIDQTTKKEMTATEKETFLKGVVEEQQLSFSAATGTFKEATDAKLDNETKRADLHLDMTKLGSLNATFSSTEIKSNVVDNATGQHIQLDLAQLKDIDNNGTSTVNGGRGMIESTEGAGWKVGELSSISIGVDGRIMGAYTNGQTKLLGQIATATFANASGLEKAGDNLYGQTANSGEAIIGDITSDGGSMNTGNLEMSNVDLSQEFTTMITTQRGFQANSRVITVSDTLLEELVNLKR